MKKNLNPWCGQSTKPDAVQALGWYSLTNGVILEVSCAGPGLNPSRCLPAQESYSVTLWTTGRRKESGRDLNIILNIVLVKVNFLFFCKDTEGDRRETIFLLKVYTINIIDIYNLARALYQKCNILNKIVLTLC